MWGGILNTVDKKKKEVKKHKICIETIVKWLGKMKGKKKKYYLHANKQVDSAVSTTTLKGHLNIVIRVDCNQVGILVLVLETEQVAWV